MARSLELIFNPSVSGGVSQVQQLEALIARIRENTKLSNNEVKLFGDMLSQAAQKGENLAAVMRSIASGGGSVPKPIVEGAKQIVNEFDKVVDSSKKARAELEQFASSVKNGIQNPLKFAGQQAEDFILQFGRMGVVAGAFAGGVVVLGKSVFNLVESFAASSREAANLASRLGVTGSQARGLQVEAQLAGVGIRSLEYSAHILATALEDPIGQGKKAADELRRLGIATHTFSGDAREMGGVLLEAVDKLSKIQNQSERADAAFRLLGRGSKELLPLIDRATELHGVMQRYGLGLDDNVIAKGRDADLQIQTMKQSFEQLRLELGRELAPITIKVVRVITDVLSGGKETFSVPSTGDPLNLESDKDPEVERRGVLGASMAQRWMAKFGATKEGLEQQLRQARDEQNRLLPKLENTEAQDPDARSKNESEFAKNDARIKKIQAQLEALKGVTKEASQLRSMLAHFDDTDVSPIARMIRTYQDDLTKLTSPADKEALRVSANAAINREIEKERVAGVSKTSAENLRQFENQQRIDEAFAREALSGDRLKNVPEFVTAQLGNVPGPPGPSYRQQISSLQRQGSYQSKLAGVRGDDGQQELGIRQKIAELELKVELEKANESKTTMERMAAEYDARFNYEQKLQQIREDNELRILRLQERETEQFKSIAVGFIHAAQSNSLPDFFRQQATRIQDTVVGNLAGMVYPTIAKAMPNIGNNGFLGSILAGTPFAGNAFTDNPQVQAARDTVTYTKLTATGVAAIYSAMTGTTIPGMPSSGVSIPGFGGPGGLSIPGLSTFGSDTNGLTGSGGLLGLGGIAPLIKLFGGGSAGTGAPSVTAGELSNLGIFSPALGGVVSKADAFHFANGSSSLAAGMFNGSGGANFAGSAIASAGAAYAGVSTAIHDFRQGGARGIIGGVGALAGAASAFDPEPISRGILMGVAVGSQLISAILGDPRQKRQNDINKRLSADQFYAPVAINASMGTNGSAVSTDRFGNTVYNDASPFPTVEQPYADLSHGITVPGRTVNPIGGPGAGRPTVVNNYNVHTLDASSFHQYLERNSDSVAHAAALALNSGGKGAENLSATIKRG